MKVTTRQIEDAEKTIRRFIQHTALEFSSSCSAVAGSEVHLKFENLQKTGSFKIRGAANKLAHLTDAEKKRGVIAASAGNHAQGVACMAKLLGIKATIVMPEMSPLIKVHSTRRFGAEVILKGAGYEDAYQHALELQSKQGFTFIHPFEDEYVIAGQGTVGLELLCDSQDFDAVYIPIGGGGLLAGIATVVKEARPGVKIIGVQAEGAPSMARSFKNHKLEDASQTVSTIADGIAVKKPSAVMFESYINRLCDDVVTVNDDEIAQTIVFLMERAKTVVEGAGSVGLAALLTKKSKINSRKPVAILSGGNIDLNMLERIIDRGLHAAHRIARILVSAPDVPGTLNRLTAVVAEKKANILQINHNRMSDRINLKETLIEFLLETTDVDQIKAIKAGFQNLGATVID